MDGEQKKDLRKKTPLVIAEGRKRKKRKSKDEKLKGIKRNM